MMVVFVVKYKLSYQHFLGRAVFMADDVHAFLLEVYLLAVK